MSNPMLVACDDGPYQGLPDDLAALDGIEQTRTETERQQPGALRDEIAHALLALARYVEATTR